MQLKNFVGKSIIMNNQYSLYVIKYEVPRNRIYKYPGTHKLYTGSFDIVSLAIQLILKFGGKSVTITEEKISFNPVYKKRIYLLESIHDGLFITNDINTVYCSSEKMARRIATHKYKNIPRKWNNHDKIQSIMKPDTYLEIHNRPLYSLSKNSDMDMASYIYISFKKVN